MTLQTKRLFRTAIFSAIIFGIVSFLNPWSFVLDAPNRYGVPLTFREVGCGMGRVIDGQLMNNCVDRWDIVNLLIDLAVVVLLVYGAVLLAIRRRQKYPIDASEKLYSFLEQYMPRVLRAAGNMGLDLQHGFIPDHLGLQVMTGAEFDQAHERISGYATLVHDEIIHGRRNRVYRFNHSITAAGMSFPGIEIFESKPGADPKTLRPGIEHAAWVSQDLPTVAARLNKEGFVMKEATYSRGRFIKTKLINGIEIELRDKTLM